MIIIFNAKITDHRFYQFNRYNLRSDNRFDTAKYCFASFAPLESCVSKYIFYLDLAEFSHRQQELQEFLEKTLPKEKLSIHWHRCNDIDQWRQAQQEITAVDDNLVLTATWEDHIFWDSNIDVWKRGLDLINQDPDPRAAMLTSHYPECMRYAHSHWAKLTNCGNFVVYSNKDDSCLRVMKRDYFDWYLDRLAEKGPQSKPIYRVEDFYHGHEDRTLIYQPVKEQLRHFDGYSHVNIGPEYNPPLDIPQGFFDGITIRYGFADRDPEAVNINPLSKNRMQDPINGADYNFLLSDMPAFWRPYIRDIVINQNLDQSAAVAARNKLYLGMTQIDFNSCYGSYTSTSPVPDYWVQNHMVNT